MRESFGTFSSKLAAFVSCLLMAYVPLATALPTPVSITPVKGSPNAPSQVTIQGTGFDLAGTTRVFFGSLEATSVSIAQGQGYMANWYYITCSPPVVSTPGQVDVTVMNPDGNTGTLANSFTYDATPYPGTTPLCPVTGGLLGGTAVGVSGTCFPPPCSARITFGGVDATGIWINSGTGLGCILPPCASEGSVSVVIMNTAFGTSATILNGFTYELNHQASHLWPGEAIIRQSVEVNISGSSFPPADKTRVTFGGVDATDIRTGNGTLIQCIAPASTQVGKVDVVVTNTVTGFSTKLTKAFEYKTDTPVTQPPELSTLYPAAGPLAGGTRVNLTISHYPSPTETVHVTVGGQAATNLELTVNGTYASVSYDTPPSLVSVSVDVSVSFTDLGTSVTKTNGYFYCLAPHITNIDPTSGNCRGNTKVTITGTDLYFSEAGGTVTFGTATGSIKSGSTNTSVLCTTPAFESGIVDVTYSTPGGSDILEDAFTFTGIPAVEAELQPIGYAGGNLGPLALAGNYLLWGSGPELRILDLADPAHPVIAGRWMATGTITDIAIENGLAYVCDFPSGLQILGIADPTEPIEIAFYEPAFDPKALAVSGTTAFLAGASGFETVDVSDPYNPVNWPLDVGMGCDLTRVSGNRLYTISNSMFYCWDLANPVVLDPETTELFEAQGDIKAAAFSGNFALFAEVSAKIEVFDMSDLGNLHQESLFSVPVVPYDITVSGQYGYAACGSTGLHILDISHPDNLTEVGVCGGFQSAQKVVVKSGYAYVIDCLGTTSSLGATLRVIDIHSPSVPTLITTDEQGISSAFGICAQGEFAYVAANLDGLRVVDISNPLVPVIRGSCATPVVMPTDPLIASMSYYSYGGILARPLGAMDTAIQGNHAYVANGESGLRIIDISDPDLPVETGSCATPGFAWRVAVAGSYAYVGDCGGGVRIIDITNPPQPVEIGSIPGTGKDVAVSGSVLYTASGIYDITDPSLPVKLGNGAGDVFDLTSHYLCSLGAGMYWGGGGGGGLSVWDVANPAAAMQIGSINLSGFSVYMAARASGPYVYAGVDHGMYVVDVTIPEAPSLVGRYGIDWPLFVWDILPAKAVYLATESGLYVVASRPPAPELFPVPPFINSYAAGNVPPGMLTISGNAAQGAFVGVGGGRYPVYQQLASGTSNFSIQVPLKREAVNHLSVATISEYGLVSRASEATVVDGAAFPGIPTSVTSLTVAPVTATVRINETQAFTCAAAFSNGGNADVTQFVQWNVTNDELITGSGLYVNTGPGMANVNAAVGAVVSNTAIVTDGSKGDKAQQGVVAGRVIDSYTGRGLPPPNTKVSVYPPYVPTLLGEHPTVDTSGNYAFLLDAGFYDLQALTPQYYPKMIRAGEALPSPSPGVSGGFAGQVSVDSPLNEDFALIPSDTEPPLVTFVEPLGGSTIHDTKVQVTAIIKDAYSGLKESVLTVNGQSFDIKTAISPQGFYRNVWPLRLGANTMRIRAKDMVGNERTVDLGPVTASFSSTELQSAESKSPTTVQAVFTNHVYAGSELITSYTIINTNTLETLAVTGVMRLTEKEVLLVTAVQVPNQTYTLSVHGIQDAEKQPIRIIITQNFTGYDTLTDSDGDGLSDLVENSMGTAPNNADTDNDGMPDGWEHAHEFNLMADDAGADADMDGVTNLEEYLHHTDPGNPDTDNDGLNDGAEIAAGTNPLLNDSDNDRLLDGWEIAHGLDPAVNDATTDTDQDGLLNLLEFLLGTNPEKKDTDEDGLTDGQEYQAYGTNPKNPDTDGDGLSDGFEVENRSNPFLDNRVHLQIVSPAAGSELSGNHVTVEAGLLGTGNVMNLVSTQFEVKPASGGVWTLLGTALGWPSVVFWPVDGLPNGAYQLRARALAKFGMEDSAPEAITVMVNNNAPFSESEIDGVLTLQQPVTTSAESRLVLSDPDRSLRVVVTIPAGALTSDTTAHLSFAPPEKALPFLSSREQDTGIYFDMALVSGQTLLANGKAATIEVTYPDTDLDGFVDGTDACDELLVLKYLNATTNCFEPLLASSVDVRLKTLTASTSHFSMFSALSVTPPSPISILTATLPPAFVDQPYSATLAAEGGDGPYRWSLTLGPLPDGLALSGNVISGALTEPGSYTIGVKVTDANGSIAYRGYGLTVDWPSGLRFTVFPYPQWLEEGQRLSLHVDVTGNSGQVNYQWKKNNHDIDNANNKDFVIEKVVLDNTGWYSCEASDNLDTRETPAVYIEVVAQLPLTRSAGILVLAGLVITMGFFHLMVRRHRAGPAMKRDRDSALHE